MSKKKSTVPYKFQFKGFINLHYNDQEKVAISDWLKAFEPDINDCIVVVAEAGYRISVTWNDSQSAYQCAITCKLKGSQYDGYCFTLTHADPGRGITILRRFYDTDLKTELYVVVKKTDDHDW